MGLIENKVLAPAGDLSVTGNLTVSGSVTAASAVLSSFLSVSTAGAAVAASGQIRLSATCSVKAMVAGSTVPFVDIGGGAFILGSPSWSSVYFDAPDAFGLAFRTARMGFYNHAPAVQPATAAVLASNGTTAA